MENESMIGIVVVGLIVAFVVYKLRRDGVGTQLQFPLSLVHSLCFSLTVRELSQGIALVFAGAGFRHEVS